MLSLQLGLPLYFYIFVLTTERQSDVNISIGKNYIIF